MAQINNQPQFNPSLSLYIPVVQKWQATLSYFKNAFKSSFVGNVARVDFVARNGGDPALATELSAYVYLEWYNNEFSTNWQKVIFAKNPQMPAHFYHTVGRNYWILCENMKPRTLEQVAAEKKVALASQGIAIIDADGKNAKLVERLGKYLATNNLLQCENDTVKSLNAKLESDLKETKLNLGTKIMGLNEELGVLEGKRIKEIYLRDDLYKNLDAGRTQIIKLEGELEQANEDHVKDKSRLKKEITSLKTRLNGALSLHKLSQMDLEEARTKIAQLEQNAQGKNGVSPQTHKELKAVFKCNSCSTKVSFISGKETNADNKHLCHTCFVKIGAWLV